jgi:hypothetical protein
LVFRIFKKAWMPLLLTVVIALGAYAVVRIRDVFGSNPVATAGDEKGDDSAPFSPKHITYEITGSRGGRADVDYLDEDGQPHRIDATALPWSVTIVTTLPSMSANIVAQGSADMQTIGCKVIVDGSVRDDRAAQEYQPFIYCIVKSV